MVSKTTVLFGAYDITIDEKNRLLIPAEVRRALDPERDGEAFFVIIGRNRKPWLFPERGYEQLVARLASQMTPGEDKLAFEQIYFGSASRVEWDKQGRLLVPETSRRRTALNRDITMVGVRDHLELWNRPDWDVRREELFARSEELAAKQDEAEIKFMSVSKN